MPTQVDVTDKNDRTLSVQEAVERLRERGLPIPPSLFDPTADMNKSLTIGNEAILENDVETILENEDDVEDAEWPEQELEIAFKRLAEIANMPKKSEAVQADALSIGVPPSLLGRADEVIE